MKPLVNTVGIAVFDVNHLKLPDSLETDTAMNTEWEYDLPYSDSSLIKKKKWSGVLKCVLGGKSCSHPPLFVRIRNMSFGLLALYQIHRSPGRS